MSNTQKHTLNLFEGDFARLQELYPDAGASLVIRTLVRRHIDEKTPKVDTSEVKVEI